MPTIAVPGHRSAADSQTTRTVGHCFPRDARDPVIIAAPFLAMSTGIFHSAQVTFGRSICDMAVTACALSNSFHL